MLRCERPGSPQRTPTYASGCRAARASPGSQLAPVPVVDRDDERVDVRVVRGLGECGGHVWAPADEDRPVKNRARLTMDPEARKVVELGYGGSERLTMNMGPQHPSAHGVVRAI